MKRLIYTAIVLLVAAVGCNKSDLVDVSKPQKTLISFETYTGKSPITKASSVTTETLCSYNSSTAPAFHVNAYMGTTGSYVEYINQDMWCKAWSKDAETGAITATWEAAYANYWPNDNSLTFVAYGANTPRFEATESKTQPSPGELVPVEGSFTSFTYDVPAKVSQQKDLIVAKPVTQNASVSSGVVSLEFKHLLSRVGFSLKTTGTEGTVTIKSIKLNGAFYQTGDVDLFTASPEIFTTGKTATVTSYSLFDNEYSSTATKYDFFHTNSPGDETAVPIFANNTREIAEDKSHVDTQHTDNTNRYLMIIPSEQATTATIEVVYQLSGATEQTKSVQLDATAGYKFKAGYAYEFVIKILSESIEFTGVVEKWDPEAGDNVDLN